MRPAGRWALVAASLALGAAIAPPHREIATALADDLAPEERALHAVLAPFAAWIASWHWLAAGAAMQQEDADEAYEHARALLRWLPQDDARSVDLVLYFGLGAAGRLLQESPPRVELAFTLIHRAVELGEVALQRRASPAVLEVLRLILGELELDYGGNFGLDARWERARGERPARTFERLAAQAERR